MFDVDFALKLFPLMVKYLRVTLSMSVLALGIALPLAVGIALLLQVRRRVVYPVLGVYVSFFRGTPLIAQLFFLYFGVVQVVPGLRGMDAFTAAVLGLSLNAAAYMSETLRGALAAVDKGQLEACLSVGMTYLQAMRRVVLPQAARVAVPALANNFVDIVKGSALAFTLGVTELTATAQMEGAAAYRFMEAFTDVIIMYWIIALALGYLQQRLERQLNKAY